MHVGGLASAREGGGAFCILCIWTTLEAAVPGATDYQDARLDEAAHA